MATIIKFSSSPERAEGVRYSLGKGAPEVLSYYHTEDLEGKPILKVKWRVPNIGPAGETGYDEMPVSGTELGNLTSFIFLGDPRDGGNQPRFKTPYGALTTSLQVVGDLEVKIVGKEQGKNYLKVEVTLYEGYRFKPWGEPCTLKPRENVVKSAPSSASSSSPQARKQRKAEPSF